MSVKLYSEYYYKGHESILTDINTGDRIELKESCYIRSVINNTSHIIRFFIATTIIKEHCILPHTHEPIIYVNIPLFNTVVCEEYIEENIQYCQTKRRENLKYLEVVHNTDVQEFKRRINISRNEISQNEIILYNEYAYKSAAPLVLYTDDIEFSKIASSNGKHYIKPRIIKSIKNNSRYYIVFGFKKKPHYCIPPKTNEPYIFIIDNMIDTVLFYDEPNDFVSSYELKEKCTYTREYNTPDSQIANNLNDRDLYKLSLKLYTDTNFNGDSYNIPLIFLLTYNAASLSNITIRSYHNFTTYFFLLYDANGDEYIVQPNKTQNDVLNTSRKFISIQRIDNPSTRLHSTVRSSLLPMQSTFTKLSSLPLKSRLPSLVGKKYVYTPPSEKLKVSRIGHMEDLYDIPELTLDSMRDTTHETPETLIPVVPEYSVPEYSETSTPVPPEFVIPNPENTEPETPSNTLFWVFCVLFVFVFLFLLVIVIYKK